MRICPSKVCNDLWTDPPDISHFFGVCEHYTTASGNQYIFICVDHIVKYSEEKTMKKSIFRIPNGKIGTLGKPSIKKKGNFVNKIHKTLTPPPVPLL